MQTKTTDSRIPLLELAEEAGSRTGENPLPEGIVAPGRRVTLYFSLSLPEGELIDSCFGREAVSFVLGDGNMLPGFEQCLIGMQAGDTVETLLPPEQAFGEPNRDNVQSFPRFRFPPDMPLETGLMIDFADSAGNSQAGMIESFDSERVRVDFNHPLAGRTILFRAEITGVGD